MDFPGWKNSRFTSDVPSPPVSLALSGHPGGSRFIAVKIRSLLLCGGMLAIALTTIFPVCHAEQKSAAYSDTEAGRHTGDEATVTGKVASVSKSGKGTMYVNFGDKFPRQTFCGVVFAKDADKVGDLSQFEGRTVALTGRIEMSPDGKPQIIIKVPGQLKLADNTAPERSRWYVPKPLVNVILRASGNR